MNGNQNGIKPHKRFANVVRNILDTDFVDKTQNERIREKELGKMVENGNIFAKHQQNVDRTGLRVNFVSLLPKEPCKHLIDYENGLIERRIVIQTTRCGDFIFREEICTLCWKTLEITVYKPKRPRRLEG